MSEWPHAAMLTAEQRQTRRHDPGKVCGDDHCWHHHIDEPVPPKAYLICGECMHVYRRRRDLRRAWRSNIWRDRGQPGWWWLLTMLLRRADRISFCQFCSHDF